MEYIAKRDLGKKGFSLLVKVVERLSEIMYKQMFNAQVISVLLSTA